VECIRVEAVRRRYGSRDGGCRHDFDLRTLECALGLALLIWAGLSPCVLEAAEQVFIGRIVVNTLDVFSPEEVKSFLNRGANALHVVTRESTVRRLLIFEEGDAYDPAILEEAERNLRALGLFRSVSIVAGEVHNGAVDVEVNTQDAWTVQIDLSAGRSGGAMRGGIALGEKNILGTGAQVEVAFAKDQDRTYRSVELLVPNFFLPFATARVLYGSNSDGSERILEVQRPFYSTAAPWSAEVAVADTHRDEFTYEEGGAVRATFGADHFRLFAAYGIALPAQETYASRLSIGLDLREDRFRQASTGEAESLPADRRFRYVFLQYEALHADFLKWNYVNHDDRYEDIGVGPRVLLRLGISPAAFGVAETTGIVGLELGAGFRVGASGFVQARMAWDSRVGPQLENSLASANVLYVRRFETDPRQTFVAQLSGLRGWNLDGDVQIFADALSGLRAYRLRAFEGDTRIILNLEHRMFSSMKWFGLISPGLAAFFDAGLVGGGPTRSLRLPDIKMDAGLGLRFAVAWAPGMNVFRIDAGYAFQRDPTGHKGWLISFSTGQAF
jgi:Surface antigen variable number repeat